MKYKVNDRVRIKSLDWYNENKTTEGCLVCGSSHIHPEMICMLGKIVTISSVEGNHYRIKEYAWNWTDEMIEGLVEEETKPKYEDEVTGQYYSTPKYLVRPSGYQFVDENGNVINATKIVLEKKKKEYPKTYEECCDVLHTHSYNQSIVGYKNELFSALQKLLICRDAYWKLYGEEMGLGKPWEPDWNDEEQDKYGLYEILKYSLINPSQFVFPTAEMRDAFKENFDPDIEFCKELL